MPASEGGTVMWRHGGEKWKLVLLLLERLLGRVSRAVAMMRTIIKSRRNLFLSPERNSGGDSLTADQIWERTAVQ